MEGWQKVLRQPAHGLVHTMLFAAMLALPWANKLHLTSFLFIGIGIVLILRRDIFISYTWLGRQFIFLALSLYYIFQVITYIRFPHDHLNRAAIDQKASLVVVPVLLYILMTRYAGIRQIIIYGLVCGNFIASIYCLTIASLSYLHTGNTQVFFYHTYASPVGLSAIYLSLYLLVSLIYLMHYILAHRQKNSWHLYAAGSIILFFYLNLVLLDSKMMLAMAIVLLAVFIHRLLRTGVQRGLAYVLGFIAVSALFLTPNPVRKRYTDIHPGNYATVFSINNFTDFPFDGLNLRLLLWRMGAEEANEHQAWITGNGGEHYKEGLNQKIRSYKLYTGDTAMHTTGYLNYNMHNQYMESYVQSGLVGMLLLLSLTSYAGYYAIRHRLFTLTLVVLLFAVSFLSESVMETQSGILILTLILSSEWIQVRKTYRPAL